MSGWPVTLGLGQGGPASFCLDGLRGGGMALNLRRILIPVFISGYAGRDFQPLSVMADDVFAIDLAPAIDIGDRPNPDTLQTLFFPVDAPATQFAAALDGPPALAGTIAAQAIGQPPAGRYALGFSCRTMGGRTIEIHSFFNAVGCRMPPEGKMTPLTVTGGRPPGFLGRVGFWGRAVGGIRYAIRGVAPDDWFGPLQPMEPVAPALEAPRRFDYRSGLNIQYQPRGEEGVSFAQMRALADSYDVLRLVIETRKDQVERLRWNIRPKVAAGRRTANAAADPRVAMLEGFFRKPDGVHRWGTWLRMLLEDLFVIDAPALYKARGIGGALLALEPVDGATIKVLIDDQGRTPAAPDPAFQQVLHGVPKADFSRDELIYLPRNPRTAMVYGFSPVEQIIATVNIALRRQLAQMQYFTEGNMPEALIGVPQSWTMEQIGQFQDYWDTILAGNTAERRHAKFVPADFKYQPMRDPPLKDDFDEWLARIVCYAFSASPAPFTRQMNRATADNAQEMALAEGLAPVMLWVKWLIDQVIEEDFGCADLEFEWIDEKSDDPMRQAQIIETKLRLGLKTINEARAESGEDPVEGGDTPLIYTGAGAVTLKSVLGAASPAQNTPPGEGSLAAGGLAAAQPAEAGEARAEQAQ